MPAGLMVYTYEQRIGFTLGSEDYLELNPLRERSSANYGRVPMPLSGGGGGREGVRTGEFLVGSGLLVKYVLFSRQIA